MRENIELRIEQKLSCKTSLLLAQSCRATKFNNGWTRNCSISSRKTVIVTDEEMYGNKQIISITPRIYDYTLQNVHKPQGKSSLRNTLNSEKVVLLQIAMPTRSDVPEYMSLL
ncbi:uncharacterized protein LOC123195886 isoform X1 [Mangifera indica]|uniref:uncharacterized protein LOC123195886 isoform X1 n=1 Tax=Mangifera indica TaxID=29780 RepID=UPI001CFB7DE4|nr:uncharacterized protein LOC123195886 isoform X1 [Mangifera indica]